MYKHTFLVDLFILNNCIVYPSILTTEEEMIVTMITIYVNKCHTFVICGECIPRDGLEARHCH